MEGVCAVCGFLEQPVKRCSRCKSVSYCSKDCQEKHWFNHKANCENNASSPSYLEFKQEVNFLNDTKECCGSDDLVKYKESSLVVKIKYKGMRRELIIPRSTSAVEAFGLVCNHLKISAENLRLVSRGKLITKHNISEFLTNGAAFQAFGEESEDESGLDVRDIEVLMSQLSVERNVAIRALKKTGDLVDAILYVSDNM